MKLMEQVNVQSQQFMSTILPTGWNVDLTKMNGPQWKIE